MPSSDPLKRLGDIDIDIIWELVLSRLPLLKAACRAELAL